MVSLHTLVRSLFKKHEKTPKTQRLEAELVPVIGNLVGKRNRVFAASKDFERTVTDFLNDRKEFEARRND